LSYGCRKRCGMPVACPVVPALGGILRGAMGAGKGAGCRLLVRRSLGEGGSYGCKKIVE